MTSDDQVRAAAELAARTSYGRLLALLAAGTSDVASAEDALATAFERALTTWPTVGVPTNPEGWLLTVARNARRDLFKSAAFRTSTELDDEVADQFTVQDVFADIDEDAIGDKRLELLFVCAHPAIDPAIRTPLMLQAALGFEAADIATAFAVKPATMAQRLVRAKNRIKLARIPFVVPVRSDLADRLPSVLEAIYGCFALSLRTSDDTVHDLAGEAQYLAITLASRLESEPEAWSLAALVTFSLARAPARVGGFVALDEQDPALWDARLIAEADGYLRRAATPGQPPGRFQIEAAIQAVHCDRARTGALDWAALQTLYAALLQVAPTLGARVAYASVLGRTDSAAAGLAALGGIAEQAAGFQPFLATRADLLVRDGRAAEAAADFARAADLAVDPAVAEHLRARAQACDARG